MPSAIDLSGGVAPVGGGSRGLGPAIATAITEAGADVAVIYRRCAAEARAPAEVIRRRGRRADVRMGGRGLPPRFKNGRMGLRYRHS